MDIVAQLSSFIDIFGKNTIARVAALILIVTLLIGGAIIYDYMTGNFTLGRLEHQILLLEKLHLLGQQGIATNPTLQNTYERLAAELENYNPRLLPEGYSFGLHNMSWAHFLGGFGFWIFLGIASVRGKPISQLGVPLFLGLTIPAITNLIFPTFQDVLLDGFVGFFVQIAAIIILFVLMIPFMNRKATNGRTKVSNTNNSEGNKVTNNE